jgi:hypothetical protein
MKLPGGASAIVEISKLRDYCLDPHHPRGRHTARVFLSALYFRRGDSELLRSALLKAAEEEDAVPGEADDYGDRYTVDFRMTRGDREGPERLDYPSWRIGSAAHELFCTIRRSWPCANSNYYRWLHCSKMSPAMSFCAAM